MSTYEISEKHGKYNVYKKVLFGWNVVGTISQPSMPLVFQSVDEAAKFISNLQHKEEKTKKAKKSTKNKFSLINALIGLIVGGAVLYFFTHVDLILKGKQC